MLSYTYLFANFLFAHLIIKWQMSTHHRSWCGSSYPGWCRPAWVEPAAPGSGAQKWSATWCGRTMAWIRWIQLGNKEPKVLQRCGLEFRIKHNKNPAALQWCYISYFQLQAWDIQHIAIWTQYGSNGAVFGYVSSELLVIRALLTPVVNTTVHQYHYFTLWVLHLYKALDCMLNILFYLTLLILYRLKMR